MQLDVAAMDRMTDSDSVVSSYQYCAGSVVSQLMDANLHSQIKRKFLFMPRRLEYARQMLSGLSDLHQRGIFHMDVQTKNVLLLRNVQEKNSQDGFRAPERSR